MVESAKSGHPGLPLGMADVMLVLFQSFLKYNPKDPTWPDRDRFILSAGHGSALLYSALHLAGYEKFPLEELKRFRQLESLAAGHPEYCPEAGIETSTGPLGQGIGNAVGMAISEKAMKARFNSDVVNHKMYIIAGDGCLMEGINQEVTSLAGHLKLDNLIVLWDDNEISIDGPTSLTTSEDHLARYQASGWITKRINGHDYKEIHEALLWANQVKQPVIIACKTKIGFGSPVEGSAKAHGAPLGEAGVAALRQALGWDHPPFTIPSEIIQEWQEFNKRNQLEYQRWQAAYKANQAFQQFLTGQPDFTEDLKSLKHDLIKHHAQKQEATRKLSGDVINILTSRHNRFLGGSADLTPSNNTKASQQKIITTEDFSTSYIHYGVREHGMASIMNGIAAHGGFIPYGGTFLVFSDYMRPAIRLSALIGLRVIYILTHDSIGLGEDGPTHQPVEHLASLRAIPNLQVFRPCDAAEVVECWELALASSKTPSVLALSRQNLPSCRQAEAFENLSEKGAYVISRSIHDKAEVGIYATGSEVYVAIAAQASLEEQGIATDVISMPSFELFRKQSKEYRQAILSYSHKVAIEAACIMGWHEVIGADGLFLGVNTFGYSAPGEVMFAKFELTPEKVVEKVKGCVKRYKTTK
jgi:transketolase